MLYMLNMQDCDLQSCRSCLDNVASIGIASSVMSMTYAHCVSIASVVLPICEESLKAHMTEHDAAHACMRSTYRVYHVHLFKAVAGSQL